MSFRYCFPLPQNMCINASIVLCRMKTKPGGFFFPNKSHDYSKCKIIKGQIKLVMQFLQTSCSRKVAKKICTLDLLCQKVREQIMIK